MVIGGDHNTKISCDTCMYNMCAKLGRKKVNKLGFFAEYEFEGSQKRYLHYEERDEQRRIVRSKNAWKNIYLCGLVLRKKYIRK